MEEERLTEAIPKWIIDSQSFCLGVVNEKGAFVFKNSTFKNRFNYHIENYEDFFSDRSIHPEDIENFNVFQLKRKKLIEATTVVRVANYFNDSIDYYWAPWELSLVTNQKKNAFIICLGGDSSEIEKVNKRAKTFVEKAETIIENITDGFCIINRDWQFVKLNKNGANLLGVESQKVYRKYFWDIFPNSASNGSMEMLSKAMNENVSVRFQNYSAEVNRWFRSNVYPSAEGLTIIFKDISDEIKNREELQTLNNQLIAIYNSTNEASTYLTKDFKIQYHNKVAKDICKSIFGKEPSIGECSLLYMLPELHEEFIKYYHQALTGETIRVEKNDSKDWWQFSIFPVYDSSGVICGLAHNVINITERKNAEARILKQNENLKKIAWEQSHEVRQPLAQILGLINLIQMEHSSNTEQLSIYLKLLGEAAKSLDGIIHKIVARSNQEY